MGGRRSIKELETIFPMGQDEGRMISLEDRQTMVSSTTLLTQQVCASKINTAASLRYVPNGFWY
ncbi:MAG: hypothetical protein JSS57_04950 [Proteobacteria bacterium]|nr:hypothetical protein [Pseudomonadota bacterium]